jgi:SAM-dependent methyltransferase
MSSLDVVGSDLDNFECPYCGAHDRERHLFLYLQAVGLLISVRGQDVLHFAPERQLSGQIAASGPSRYVKCDLCPQSADLARVDMLAIPFDTKSFDIVIANHVLEHVADDLQALAEIRRVLRVGGHAILQTPYSRKLNHTWQDPGIADARSRLQAYGQEDHVRLYGRDIFERFASVGLESRVRQHSDLLPDVDPVCDGINPDEPFFHFQRFQ